MWLNNLFTVLSGTGIDLMVGDPSRIPHPVVGFGKLIACCDDLLNRKGLAPWKLRLGGLFTVTLVVGIAFWVPYLILKWLTPIPWLFWTVNIWLMSTTIAAKGLNQAGQRIFTLLKAENLAGARSEVGQIVGRDTANLSSEGVIRATVETIAENTVDGVIAPIFFGFLGGTPLALAYRAINTLDSMLGYKNERYLYFGWAAARLDDLANLIPARLSALMMFISAFLLRLQYRESIKTTFRDAGKHPSPNGGWPEAAVAGALGIRLGGQNFYQGSPSFRNYLGDATRELEINDIFTAKKILNVTLVLFLITISLIGVLTDVRPVC